MDESKSPVSCESTEKLEETNFADKFVLRDDSLTQLHTTAKIDIHNELEEAVAQSDTVLPKMEDKRGRTDTKLNENSINATVVLKSCTSADNISNLSSINTQSTFSNGDLPSSVVSLSLPTLFLSSQKATVTEAAARNKANDSDDTKITYSDEEETLFNNSSFVTYSSYDNRTVENIRKPDSKENVTGNEGTVNAVQNGETTQNVAEPISEKIEENVEKCRETVIQKPVSVRNARTYRPTLADDSRLVKISLPTNPMSIMHSNAQFINKSRNFLNYITEKSTNIMEKALLPQNLAVKYNSVLKLTDANCPVEKKYVEESCISTESFLTDLTSSSESDLSKAKSQQSFVYRPSEIETGVNQSKNVDYSSQLRFPTNIKETKIHSVITHNGEHSLSTNDLANTTLSSNKEDYSFRESLDRIDSPIAEKETREETTYSEINGNYAVSEFEDNTSSSDKDHVDAANQENLVDNDVKTSKHGLLQHPAYLTLLKDYASLKAKHLKLSERVESLEQKNRALEAEKNGEVYAIQIETLEKTVDRLTSELRTVVAAQETLKKDYAAANKERESMVMKYAVSEKQLIDTQRARDYAERKMKESLKDQDLLQNKLRQAQGERTRICNILDGKCREVSDLQKEVERLKEEVQMRDVKLKWTQTKLKTEMDLQKETQQKLDKALTRINEMKEECEQVRRESQESIRKFQQSEENKAVTLDQQLKEQQARLILERHVTEDKEMLCLQLQKEVDTLKHRQQALIEENNTLSLRIQESEKSRLSFESSFNSLKLIAEQRQKEIVDLLSKVSQLETLKLQLQHKEQCLASVEAEIENLRQANEDLQSDMRACRQREADMLDFTQKLTDKNVRLQSEFTAIEARAKQLEDEQGPLRERLNELNNKVKLLEESLSQEQKKRTEECEILAKHVAEQTQLAQNLAQKLEDSQGENAVLKRKQQLSMKEMTRELQQYRKKLEAYEAASPNSLSVASRTGSNTSLNTGDALNGALSDNSASSDHTIHNLEPDRQALIDRIIKLQKINVRRAEKLDFLEEHTRTLVEELQKKTKIIQNYILHENFGAMGSNERDRHKAELARHGGIMASVYNQRVSDDNMTLELSLEINQKLQAVLEDALLKNITLKDNIDTLGEEIARLTMQNQQRQITQS